jgi:polyhydroxybutyrate depolymerase
MFAPLSLLAFSAVFVACGSDATPGGTGGSPGIGTGGATASGGAATSGASNASGGATSSGGTTTASGGIGAPASGGSPFGRGGASNSAGAGQGGAKTGPGGGGAPWGGGGFTFGMGGTVAGKGGSAGGPTAGSGNGAGGQSNVGGSASGGSNAGGGTSVGGSSVGGGTSVTCPSTALKSGDSSQTLMVGSTSRSYVLHVPSAYDGTKAVPLVIDFHGLSGSGQQERSSSPYPAVTDPDGVIMAFPTGLSGPSGSAWNVGPCCVKDVDDVAFAKALVSQIEKTACIDPKRVYAVGFSMGGGLSHYLACHAADVFAAVAPAAFDLLEENVNDCKPQRPISVISFRSTSDPIVPYNGGYSPVVTGMPITFLGAKGTFQKWSELNQCSGSASAEDSNGCASYSGCQDGVDVVLCTKQGGTHEPGNAKVAWPLLKKHTLP